VSFDPMARKQLAMNGRITRLEARTRAIGVVNRLVFAALCMAGGFVVVAAALPEKRQLNALEEKLREAQAREAAVKTRKDDRLAEYRSLKEDPAYLELQARDRLDVCRDGERVLRFKRGE
jgi:cell division protein FtsB